MRQHCQNNLTNTNMAVIFMCVIAEQCHEPDNKGWPSSLHAVTLAVILYVYDMENYVLDHIPMFYKYEIHLFIDVQ